MPRAMPPLARTFGERVDAALALANAGEQIRFAAARGSVAALELRPSRLEALHEMAYLRIFVEWENFLEATFLRMMCGYVSPLYIPAFVAGKTRCLTLADAQTDLFGTRDFVLWHNPAAIERRGREWFSGGPHEGTVISNQDRLGWFAAVRHGIAHRSEDAKQKLDNATNNLNGRRYPGSSAGRFLRDWNRTASPAERWLSTIGGELRSLARQIAPV